MTLAMFPAATTFANPILSMSNGKYQLPLRQSGIIMLNQPAKSISIGSSKVADMMLMPNQQLYVLAQALGTTNIILWNKENKIFQSFDLEVVHDLDTLKLKLHQLFPEEAIKVHSAQGKLMLSGQVSSIIKMNAALQLAAGFLPECAPRLPQQDNKPLPGAMTTVPQGGMQEQAAIGDGSDVANKLGGMPGAMGASAQLSSMNQQNCGPDAIINMLEVAGAQQVMLEVKVAEMARDILRRLDSNANLLNFGKSLKAGANSGGATFPNELFDVPLPGGGSAQRNISAFRSITDGLSGPVINRFQPTTPKIDAKGLFLGYLTGDMFLQAALEISRRKGLAKILAEPTLTAITGQEAEFLSGGEFPIPVPRTGNQGITIEFKKFGVQVRFLPVVLDSGRINLKLGISVSELSNNNAVAISPGSLLGAGGTNSVFVIPSLTERSASSSIELADGQTMGIAGLINENTKQFVEKLPGLGDVPMLGQLFRSQEYRSGLTELVMFVTPHLAKPMTEKTRLPTDSFVPPNDFEFYLMGKSEGSLPADARIGGAHAIKEFPKEGNFGHDL